MKGIIGNRKGTLLKYDEVFKKLKIPKEYLFELMFVDDFLVTIYLKKIEKIVIGKITPHITDITTVSSIIRITKDDFRKKLGLKYDNFDTDVYFMRKTSLLRIGGEELRHCLEKDSERVYLWISEEEANRRERFFVKTG